MLAPTYWCPTAFNLLLHAAPQSRKCSLCPTPHLSPLFCLLFFWLLGFPCLPPSGPPNSPVPVQETVSPHSQKKLHSHPLRKGSTLGRAGGAGSRVCQHPFFQHPSPVKSQWPLPLGKRPLLPGKKKKKHDPWGGGVHPAETPTLPATGRPLSTSLSCPRPPFLSTLLFAPLLPSSDPLLSPPTPLRPPEPNWNC